MSQTDEQTVQSRFAETQFAETLTLTLTLTLNPNFCESGFRESGRYRTDRRSDRQTDRQTDDIRSQDRALHSSASRVKKSAMTEEARCHAVMSLFCCEGKGGRGGPYGLTTLAAAKPAKPPRKCQAGP